MNEISIVTPLIGCKRGARLRNWKVVHAHLKKFLLDENCNIEWIVPEQGGTAAERYGVKKVPVYGKRNRSEMRNIGWRNAAHDMICFLDADLVMRPEAWESAFSRCFEFDVYSPYRRGVKLGRRQTANRINQIIAGDWSFSVPKHKRWNLCGGICFMRKSVLEAVMGWDERFWGWGYEDIAMNKLVKQFHIGSDQHLAMHLFHGTAKGRRYEGRMMRRIYRSEYANKSFREIMERRRAAIKPKSASKHDNKVTAVLNAWGRPHLMQRQINAVKKQTAKPMDVMVWQNASASQFSPQAFAGTIWANCSQNLGVWSRFAFALNARSEYVCVFDDDTIPGKEWFRNCIETIEKFNGLIGTAGVIFQTPNSYYPCTFHGWKRPQDKTQQVDIVGHAWFFRRDWLADYWAELPSRNHNQLCGEDIHFSYVLQKKGINTFVPPHPVDNREMWGSLMGEEGAKGPALSKNDAAHANIKRALPEYVNKGFRLLCQDNPK